MNLIDPLPALLVSLVIIVCYLLPLVISVWIVAVLHRIRTTQQAMDERVNAIERTLKSH